MHTELEGPVVSPVDRAFVISLRARAPSRRIMDRMTILRLHGPVSSGDPCRVSSDEKHGAIWVGDTDVVAEINDAIFKGGITVAVADERFTTDTLVSDLGYGYSEFTPMEPDNLQVGDHDLIEILGRYEGQTITLVLADEPVDLGAIPA